MSLLGEQRLEGGSDAAHRVREFLERFEGRFTLDNPRFMERYMEEELAVLLHLRFEEFVEEYVAYFQRALPLLGAEDDGRQRLDHLIGDPVRPIRHRSHSVSGNRPKVEP